MDIKLHLRRSADIVGRRLRKKGYAACGAGIKLKTFDFKTLTRGRQLSEPTDVTESLYSVCLNLLEHIDHPGPFRLVGLVAYDLVEIDSLMQLDLFGTLAPRRRLDFAIDGLADRYGIDVVYRADAPPSGMRLAPTLDFLDDRTFD